MSIIFIAGLTRSGTTFLQAQLLRYESVVALGEVSQTIEAIRNLSKEKPKWKVRIGLERESYWNPKTYSVLLNRVEKDSFWGPIKTEVEEAADMQKAIEIVYEKAKQKYPGHVLIDSSKHIDNLKNVLLIKKFRNDIKTILSIRDYRGWLFSTKKHRDRVGYKKNNDLIEIYKWFYSNQKLIRFLYSNAEERFRIISYDKLVFSYEKSMKELASFCGLNKISSIENSHKFHEILGSQSFKKQSTENVTYDSSWFCYRSNMLEWPVSTLNKKIYLKYSV